MRSRMKVIVRVVFFLVLSQCTNCQMLNCVTTIPSGGYSMPTPVEISCNAVDGYTSYQVSYGLKGRLDTDATNQTVDVEEGDAHWSIEISLDTCGTYDLKVTPIEVPPVTSNPITVPAASASEWINDAVRQHDDRQIRIQEPSEFETAAEHSDRNSATHLALDWTSSLIVPTDASTLFSTATVGLQSETNSIQLFWYAPTICESSYTISIVSNGVAQLIPVDSENGTSDVTNLQSNQLYDVLFDAIYHFYEPEKTPIKANSSQSVRTKVAGPTDFVVTVGASTANLSWTEPKETVVADCHYNISWDSGTKDVPTDQTSTEIAGLLECTKYTFSLQLVCSGQSSPAIIAEEPTLADVEEVNLACSATNVSISCSLFPAGESVCPASSIFYDVCFSTTSRSTDCMTVPFNTSTVTKDNLQPCSTYNVSLTPRVDDPYFGSATGPSTSLNINTESSRPGPVTALNAVQVSPTVVSVSWTAPNPMPCALAGYNVFYSTAGTPNNGPCANSSVYVRPQNNSVQLTGLCACRTYSISVEALTASGSGPATLATATTPAATPSIVTFLEPSAVSNTSITFAWQPDGGTCYVTYNVTLTSEDKSVGTDDTSHTFDYLTPYKEYEVSVLACTRPDLYGTPLCTPATSQLQRTAEGAPGKPSLEIYPCLPLNETAMSCNVTWLQPEKNGILQPYELSCDCTSRAVDSLTSKVVSVVSNETFSTLIYPQPYSNCMLALIASTVAGSAETITTFSTEASYLAPLSTNSSAYENVTRDILNAQEGVNDRTSQIKVVLYFNPFGTASGPLEKIEVLYGSADLISVVSPTGSDPSMDAPGLMSVFNYTALSVPLTSRVRSDLLVMMEHTVYDLESGTNYTFVLRGWTSCCYSNIPLLLQTEPYDPTGLIIGIVVASLVLIFLIILVLHLYSSGKFSAMTRKKGSRNSKKRETYVNNVELEAGEQRTASVAQQNIVLHDFARHFEMMQSDSNLYEVEYDNIANESVSHSTDTGTNEVNYGKNRNVEIVPYDINRVELLKSANQQDDYINASYISGPHGQNDYIATQGPLQSTITDFWRMIWEQNIDVLIMLTQLVENGKRKCEKYWPDEQQSQNYGNISVTCNSETTLAGYNIRQLLITRDDSHRTLTQYHFLMWPEDSFPDDAMLLAFMQNIQTRHQNDRAAPICVHCSVGVGRTGTFLSIDRMMRQIRKGCTSINVYKTIVELSDQRRLIVKSVDQYAFIHRCIDLFLRENSTLSNKGSADENDEGNQYDYLEGSRVQQDEYDELSSPRANYYDAGNHSRENDYDDVQSDYGGVAYATP